MKKPHSPSLARFCSVSLILAALAAPSLSLAAPPPVGSSRKGGEGSAGNGGGGVLRNDRYLTFGAAGIKAGSPDRKSQLRLDPLSAQEIPGLDELLDALKGMGLNLSASNDSRLFNAIYPVGSRKYFAIANDDLDPRKRRALIDSYHRAIGAKISKKQLVIYAITNEQETYLLPEFFRLDPRQQSVILFQEAMWVVGGKRMNEDLAITGQILFEKFLSSHADPSQFDPELYHYLELALGDCSVSVVAAAKDDFRSGRLAAFLNSEGSLNLRTLFGENWLRQKTYDDRRSFSDLDMSPENTWKLNDPSILKRHAIDLSLRHPTIQLFAEAARMVDQWGGPAGRFHTRHPEGNPLVELVRARASIRFWETDPSWNYRLSFKFDDSGAALNFPLSLEGGSGTWEEDESTAFQTILFCPKY